MLGHTISHYRILEKISDGGMGVVYKAEDQKLKRLVALKFLPSELTTDETAKIRFINEAQTVSALQHNNICTIHEIDETDAGQMFIVMDLYDGESLDKKIERGPVSFDEARDIALQLALGLAAAHDKSIMHRDIKPANILVTKDGVVKIVDFGLAKFLNSPQITKERSTVGTTMYMSPEQLRGEDIDVRSDIWSFGVVLYQMLTGVTPFKGEFTEAIMYQINNVQPQPVAALRPLAPKSLSDIVSQCLHKERTDRPSSMKEIINQLGGKKPIGFYGKERLRNIAVIGGIVVGVAAVALFLGKELIKPAPVTDLRFAVLSFVNEAKDSSIAAFMPEIQSRLANEFRSVTNIVLEDRLHLNAGLVREFGNDTPPRTDDLFRFLRKNKYDFVLDGSITASSTGGFLVEAQLRKGEDYRAIEEFPAPLRSESELASVSQSLSRQVLAYLRVKELNIKPEMGVWNRNRPKNWAAVAKIEDAYSLYCAGERAGANGALVESILLDSTFVSPRIWLASSQRRSDPEGAKSNLETLRKLKPSADEFQQAMIEWLSAYFDYDPDNEIRALRKALRFDSRNRILLANLAGAYTEKHDTINALEAYKYCIESKWEFRPFYSIPVRYYLGRRNLDEAKEALMIWRSIDTTSVTPMIYAWLTAIELRKGNSSESSAWLHEFITHSTEMGVARKSYLLGSSYADVGLEEKGDSLLQVAATMEPNNADFHERLAEVRTALGRTESALSEYATACQLNPRSRGALLKMGDLLKQKGESTRARECYRKYLKVDSLSYDARQIQKYLGETAH